MNNMTSNGNAVGKRKVTIKEEVTEINKKKDEVVELKKKKVEVAEIKNKIDHVVELNKKRVEDNDDIVRINFKIRGQDGCETHFKLNQDQFFIKAFEKYCEKSNFDYETINFMLDGDRIDGRRQTPRMLNMSDGAEIFAAKHQTGGSGAALKWMN